MKVKDTMAHRRVHQKSSSSDAALKEKINERRNVSWDPVSDVEIAEGHYLYCEEDCGRDSINDRHRQARFIEIEQFLLITVSSVIEKILNPLLTLLLRVWL